MSLFAFIVCEFLTNAGRNKNDNQLLQLCKARTAWSDSMIRSASVRLFRSFSVNVLPSWLRNADQWQPDYRVVTNEKPRNKELFGADQ